MNFKLKLIQNLLDKKTDEVLPKDINLIFSPDYCLSSDN